MRYYFLRRLNSKRNESREKRQQKSGEQKWERRAREKEEKLMLCVQTLVNLLKTKLKDF